MKDLTEGKVSRQIITFATPMLIANIFQQLYNVVDGIVVGNFVGKAALAAVGASFPVLFVLISLLIGMASGITVVISQFFGARRYDDVVKAINTFFVFVIISSVVMSSLGIYFARDIFVMLHLPQDVIDPAVHYFRIYIGGLIFMFGFYGTNAILRGMGDSKTPLYLTIFSTITNLLLDLFFVIVLGWGVAGVAWASVIAQMMAFFVATIVINRGNSLVHFSLKNLRVDWSIFEKSLKIGAPIGLQQSFVAIGMIAILRIVNKFDSTDVVAAYTVAGRLDSFASMPAMTLSAALSAFVGQNIGADKLHRVQSGMKVSLLFATIISLLVTLTFYFFGRPIMGIFTNDPQVIEIGYHYLTIVSTFYVVFSAMFIMHGTLRGAGDTFVPMLITLFALWVLRVPFSAILSQPKYGLGVDGIWWGIPLAWGFGFLASLIYYSTGRWKKKAIAKRRDDNKNNPLGKQ